MEIAQEVGNVLRHKVLPGETLAAATLRLIRSGAGSKGQLLTLDVGGRNVTGVAVIVCPPKGLIELEFVKWRNSPRQGVDLKIDRGWIELGAGSKETHLRTWCDPSLEPKVRYAYVASDGVLKLWNVYERTFANHDPRTDRLDGNAGLWIEQLAESDYILHCSHGDAVVPDFESLVVHVRLSPNGN